MNPHQAIGLLLISTLALSGCATTAFGRPWLDVPFVKSTVGDAANHASMVADEMAFQRIPITKLEGQGHLICTLRGGDAWCRGDFEPFRLVAAGPLKTIAVMGFGGLCTTSVDGVVRCGSKELTIRDPEGNLVASENTVCSWSGKTVHCDALRRQFSKLEPKVLELKLPDEAGEVSWVSVYDHFDFTKVAAVDDRGAVYSWDGVRGKRLPTPKLWTIEPMRTIEINHDGFAGITVTGEVIYDERVIGMDHIRRRLCGVKDVEEVEIGMFTICARTPEGVVCAKHKFLGEDEHRVGPLHEVCEGPRGPMARKDVAHLSISQLIPLCVATNDNQVLCRAERDRVEWTPQRPVVLREAVEIAAADDWICARSNNGEVRCAGPGFAELGESEVVPELEDAERIFAGDHVLCGLFPKKLQCLYRATTKDDYRGHFRPIRAVKLQHQPSHINVSDYSISWEHEGRAHRYTLALSGNNFAARWAVRPDKRYKHRMVRFNRDRVRRVTESEIKLKDASREFYLRDDGLLFSVQRKGLSGPELAFGLLSGGIFIPAMEWNRPKYRTEHAKLPSAQEVAAGVHHVCYRNDDGGVFCFGKNDFGEVRGYPDSSWPDAKEAVHAKLDEPAKQIAAGNFFSCALLESGDVRCWGGWGHSLIRPPETYPGLERVGWDR